MTGSTENPKESIDELLELISELIKVARYKLVRQVNDISTF